MKSCSKCKVEKPSDQFYNRKESKDGLDACCKECVKKRKGGWNYIDPEAFKRFKEKRGML